MAEVLLHKKDDGGMDRSNCCVCLYIYTHMYVWGCVFKK